MKRFLSLLLICLILIGPAGCAGASTAAPEAAYAREAAFPAGGRVSYLGPEGTYTEEAARFFFPDADALLPRATVDEAIDALAAGEADYAVIPQENTLGGAVTNYVDALLARSGVYVVGEVILPISQTLMAVPGATLADIKTVCSHAQGLKQSEAWRAEHLPDAATEEMSSTAAAASHVAERQDRSVAAIAAPAAAELYGLTVLAENVQITDANKTRFYVLGAAPLAGEGHAQAVFAADCRASLLDDIILEIRSAGLELVTLHDRPEGSALGSYRYIIEVEGDGITAAQIDRICRFAEVRWLGSFDCAEKGA